MLHAIFNMTSQLFVNFAVLLTFSQCLGISSSAFQSSLVRSWYLKIINYSGNIFSKFEKYSKTTEND